MRCFVAVELPGLIRDLLGKQSEGLQEGLANEKHIRWVRPGNIHLTLKFLGEVSPERLDSIKSRLLEAVAGQPPFDLEAGGFGCFPSRERPRVLWVGVVDPTGVLGRLQSMLERSLESLGFRPETKPFHPHLTLGRVRKGLRREEMRELAAELAKVEVQHLAGWTVEDVVLFRSDLSPSGPTYTRLAAYLLEG